MIKNIGMIGDSISHGYYDEQSLGWFCRLGELILARNGSDYMFNNMSQAGDNVADTANRAICEVFSRHFDLIIVSVGINDLRRRKNSDLQLDFSEGARMMYWNKLLDTLLLTKAKILVTDLLPIIENRYMEDASLVRYNSDVVRYNEIIENICREKKINFFARHDRWIGRNLQELFKDALHPNSEGHKIIAEEVYDYLQGNQLL